MPAIPILQTPRLILRGPTRDDFPACAALWGDPAVTRFIGGQPLGPEEAWSRLLRYLGHWAAMGFGYWAVIERATDAYVGEVGFADYRRETVPSFAGTPEIGWVITVAGSGRGLATEAVTAALAWADRDLPHAETVCIIAEGHDKSERVAAKSGYRRSGPVSYRGRTLSLMVRPRGLDPAPVNSS